MNTWLSTHAKAIVGLIGVIVTYALTNFPDNAQVQTIGGLIAAVLTAYGVYQVPNAPAARKRKAARVD
jgi:hypothetical protein